MSEDCFILSQTRNWLVVGPDLFLKLMKVSFVMVNLLEKLSLVPLLIAQSILSCSFEVSLEWILFVLPLDFKESVLLLKLSCPLFGLLFILAQLLVLFFLNFLNLFVELIVLVFAPLKFFCKLLSLLLFGYDELLCPLQIG